jgi:hypothetical protein
MAETWHSTEKMKISENCFAECIIYCVNSIINNEVSKKSEYLLGSSPSVFELWTFWDLFYRHLLRFTKFDESIWHTTLATCHG